MVRQIDYVNLYEDIDVQILRLVSTILGKEIHSGYHLEFPDQEPYSEYGTGMNELERLLSDYLYYHPPKRKFIRAVNLFGADNEFITEDRLSIQYLQFEDPNTQEALLRKNWAPGS